MNRKQPPPLEPDGAVKATIPGPDANKQVWPRTAEMISKDDLHPLPNGKKRKTCK